MKNPAGLTAGGMCRDTRPATGRATQVQKR